MIRKFNELFDSEELKSNFEIPYLSDEEGFTKSFNKSMLDPTMTYVNAVLAEYPILESFKIGAVNNKFGKAVFIFSESKKPVDGINFYVQLSLQSFDRNDYIGGVLVVDKSNPESQEDRFYEFDSFKESLKVVKLFLGVCEQLNVIENKPSVLN
jgi:hypothetical protein